MARVDKCRLLIHEHASHRGWTSGDVPQPEPSNIHLSVLQHTIVGPSAVIASTDKPLPVHPPTPVCYQNSWLRNHRVIDNAAVLSPAVTV